MAIKRLDDFNHEVEVIKEVLSSMPVNNAKNVASYKAKVTELKEEYSGYRDQLFKEIKVRSNKYFSMKLSSRIDTINNELKGYEDLYLLNPVNSSYEKLGIDILLYNLTHFYKNDLESINKDIKELFSIFKLAGIELSENDFAYSVYAKKYIKELLQDDNLDRMKDVFEDLHWKCPDVIVHVEVNFRILYEKHVKDFENYINSVKSKVLTSGTTYDDLLLKKNNLLRELNQLSNYDEAALIVRFMKGELTLNDFAKANVDKCYSKFLGDNVDMSSALNKLDDFFNLYYNLNEIKAYLRAVPVIKDFRAKYQDKDKHLGECAKLSKEIEALQAECEKISHSLFTGSEKKFLFFSKKVDTEQLAIELNDKIKEINDKYEEYDKLFIYEIMAKYLDETSTIYDLLSLLLSYKGYLRTSLKSSEEDNDIRRIKHIIGIYEDYINDPYANILKNVRFNTDTDVIGILIDHYKMLNINIDEDLINLDNIDELIKNVGIIVNDGYLNKSGLDINLILSLFESKKLIEDFENRNKNQKEINV